jgi:hypothetical protein
VHAEAETKVEVGMKLEVSVEAEPDTRHVLVSEADLNDTEAKIDA